MAMGAAHLLAGRIAVARGRLRDAEAHFLAALAREPDAAQPRRELAYIDALQHRMPELNAQFRALADRDQLDDRSLLIWGRVRNGIWNPAGDMEALRTAIAADPGDRRSRLALAEGYLRSNRPDDAERVLAPLPATDPEAALHRFAVATAKGDRAAAAAALDRAGAADGHAGLLRLRGRRALSRHDPDEAVRLLRAAEAAEPGDRATRFALGTALNQAGRPDEAEPYLEAARRADAVGALMRRAAVSVGDPDPTLPTRLGVACARADRPDEARAWLKLAIRRDPLDAVAQQALFRLDHPAAAATPPAGRGGTGHADPSREALGGRVSGR